jgi:hypothetical protein
MPDRLLKPTLVDKDTPQVEMRFSIFRVDTQGLGEMT